MICLSEKYYLVTNDRFELFYRGVIKSHNPYTHYVKATCEKGYTYNRYFTYTPKEGEEGEYPLTIGVYDDEGAVIEEAQTILVVNKCPEVSSKNILCIGDSLTVNGVWPEIGYQKYSEQYPNRLHFLGKMKKGEVGYEGYGGWQWKTFCEDNQKSQTSSVWVKCEHTLTDLDQHSIWKNGDLEWVLETIEENKLKFKRGAGNNKVNPELEKEFISTTDDKKLTVEEYEYSEGNPFWNKKTNKVDFKNYLEENKYERIDYVFFLLTWNGQYKPYNNDFTIHDKYMSIIIDNIHQNFPQAKIGIMGIQLPCPNGGITACYGASGYYHDWYGETVTAFNYNKFLEEKCKLHQKYLTYFDLKAQFDVENNYWTKDVPVNSRSEKTERIGINGIHPSIDGYKQMGDAFYRFLVQMLK